MGIRSFVSGLLAAGGAAALLSGTANAECLKPRHDSHAVQRGDALYRIVKNEYNISDGPSVMRAVNSVAEANAVRYPRIMGDDFGNGEQGVPDGIVGDYIQRDWIISLGEFGE